MKQTDEELEQYFAVNILSLLELRFHCARFWKDEQMFSFFHALSIAECSDSNATARKQSLSSWVEVLVLCL